MFAHTLIVTIALVFSFISSAASLPPSSESLQRIERLEWERKADDFLVRALRHSDPKVIRRSLLAIGRLGDPKHLEALAPLLRHSRIEFVHEASLAAALIGGNLARALLSQHAQMESRPTARASLWEATALAGNRKTLDTLFHALKEESHPQVQTAICIGIAELFQKPGPPFGTEVQQLLDTLGQLLKNREPVKGAAALALSRFPGNQAQLPVPQMVGAYKGTANAVTKRRLLRAIGHRTNRHVARFLSRESLSAVDLNLRETALLALRQQRVYAATVKSIKTNLLHPNERIQATALESVRTMGKAATELSDPVQSVRNTAKTEWIRAKSLLSLKSIAPQKARPLVTEELNKTNSPFGANNFLALATRASRADRERLTRLITQATQGQIRELLPSLRLLRNSHFNDEMHAALKETIRKFPLVSLPQVLPLIQLQAWGQYADVLVEAFDKLPKEHLTLRRQILLVLGGLRSEKARPLLESAAADPLYSDVAKTAQQALKGVVPESPSPLHSTAPAPPVASTQGSNRIVFRTTRGSFSLHLENNTPYLKQSLRSWLSGQATRQLSSFFLRDTQPLMLQFDVPASSNFLAFEKHLRRIYAGDVLVVPETQPKLLFVLDDISPSYRGQYPIIGRVHQGLAILKKLTPEDKLLSHHWL